MTMLDQRLAHVPLSAACRVLGVPRATAYRARARTSAPRAVRPRKESPRPQAERNVIFATLLTRGEYLASPRTMYRILAEQFGSVLERRAQRQPHTYAVPRIEARAPNQTWTWDITKLAGPRKGEFFFLYSVLDLFSRYVVGWMLAERESAELAQQLLNDAYQRHDVWPGQLAVHSDRGAPMKSHAVADLLATLGVARSFSRPRVSNDNPFVESSFKTMKFQPNFPRRFHSVHHARSWVAAYFEWYHRHHHHSGLAFFTPENVFCGRTERLAVVRQHALDQAFSRHPQRFPKGPPTVRLPPALVAINPLFANTAVELCSRPFTRQKAS